MPNAHFMSEPAGEITKTAKERLKLRRPEVIFNSVWCVMVIFYCSYKKTFRALIVQQNDSGIFLFFSPFQFHFKCRYKKILDIWKILDQSYKNELCWNVSMTENEKLPKNYFFMFGPNLDFLKFTEVQHSSVKGNTGDLSRASLTMFFVTLPLAFFSITMKFAKSVAWLRKKVLMIQKQHF